MADRRILPGERGSTLLLFPAAVMVLFVLAAIAVDLSLVHLARRELLRSASQAAEDAGALLDSEAIHRGDFTDVDAARARDLVRYELSVAALPGTIVGEPAISTNDATGEVTVRVSMNVEHFFASVLPDSEKIERVTVTTVGRVIDRD